MPLDNSFCDGSDWSVATAPAPAEQEDKKMVAHK